MRHIKEVVEQANIICPKCRHLWALHVDIGKCQAREVDPSIPSDKYSELPVCGCEEQPTN